jgi:hypothetical protein
VVVPDPTLGGGIGRATGGVFLLHADAAKEISNAAITVLDTLCIIVFRTLRASLL